MTVSRHRRRMSTTRAVIAAVIGVGLAAVLGVAGAVAIYNTKDGQVQGSDIPVLPFPSTPTGMIAVVDADGDLSSLAVFAVRPPVDDEEDGRGGTVVPIPVSADVSGGAGSERLPINETVAMFGPESLADEVPALLGVSIDDSVVVGRNALAALLEPLGTLTVDLPAAVTDANGAEIVASGRQDLDPAAVAALLTTSDSSDGDEHYLVDVAVWRAISAAVADGLGSPLELAAPASTSAAATISGTIGDLVERLTSGPISVQPLRSRPIVSVDLNPRGVDALALDRVEVTVIFGHIAPSKVSAPYPGYNFRVISPFSDDQLVGGVTRLDVAYTAAKALFGIEANVISVDTVAGEADTATVVEVNDDGLIAGAARLSDVFGPVEVRISENRIAGIDVVVTLGTDYLALLDTDGASATSAVGPPGSAGTASSAAGPPPASDAASSSSPVGGTG